MDKFEKAYRMGQYQARSHFMNKEAGATDMAELLKVLGSGAVKGVSGMGKALKGAMGGAQATGRGAKYLGVTADPRLALAGGIGLAGAGAMVGDDIAQHVFKEGLGSKAMGALPAVMGAGGGALALAANPGLLGGSSVNRITHELAMASATPAGTLATMAGLVGLPAALIGYGKMKGQEESSWL